MIGGESPREAAVEHETKRYSNHLLYIRTPLCILNMSDHFTTRPHWMTTVQLLPGFHMHGMF